MLQYLQQLPIHRIDFGDDVTDYFSNKDKLVRKLELTFDLSQWKEKIYSIQRVAQGIYNDDSRFYITPTEIGVEHKCEPCIRWGEESKACVPLTSNFDNDLKNLAKIVLSDFNAWIEYELKQIKEDCGDNQEAYLEESYDFNEQARWVRQELE